MQSPKQPVNPPPLSADEIDLRNRMANRVEEMRLERSTWEVQWRDIARLILPQRGRFLPDLNKRAKRQNAEQILDPTGTKAHQKLAAFLMAGITNPSLDWLRLGVGDPGLEDQGDVKEWLADCEKKMMAEMSSSNFYQMFQQIYEEIAGFATGCALILPDDEFTFWCYPLTVGEYFLGLDKRQNVNELCREYTLTMAQAVEEFGLENCSVGVQSAHLAGRGLSQRITIQHWIAPNRNRDAALIGYRGAKWVSIYAEKGRGECFLRKEGFSYKPFIAPRWHALPGDAYGQGPGHVALPEVKSLQAITVKLLLLIQKLAEPPMMADAMDQSAIVGMDPGQINYLSGLSAGTSKGLQPVYQVSPQIQPMAEKVKEYQATIESTFFNDTIQAISSREGIQPLNEVEVAERRQEKLLLLGPMLLRIIGEALTPSVRIVFHIMSARGMFGQPPAALHGTTIEPRFVSVLEQAQKSVGTTGAEQLIRFVGGMVQAFPEAAMCINVAQLIQDYGTSLNIPPHTINDPAKVKAMKDAMAHQQQQEQSLQNAQALATSAQTLSKTDVGGGRNALEAMSGG